MSVTLNTICPKQKIEEHHKWFELKDNLICIYCGKIIDTRTPKPIVSKCSSKVRPLIEFPTIEWQYLSLTPHNELHTTPEASSAPQYKRKTDNEIQYDI